MVLIVLSVMSCSTKKKLNKNESQIQRETLVERVLDTTISVEPMQANSTISFVIDTAGKPIITRETTKTERHINIVTRLAPAGKGFVFTCDCTTDSLEMILSLRERQIETITAELKEKTAEAAREVPRTEIAVLLAIAIIFLLCLLVKLKRW